MEPRSFLRDLFASAVQAVRPANCLAGHWPEPPSGRLAILALGKAAAAMAGAAVDHYGEALNGLVLVPDGHDQGIVLPPTLKVVVSSHPLPDTRSLAAADAALTLVKSLQPDDLLLVLLSGGGSAVMAKPAESLDLEQKRELTQQLQAAGASIAEINQVRIRLSAVKGGRVAAVCRARILSLAISDVPGNDPALIASGPTIPDRFPIGSAEQILARYGIRTTASVLAVIRRQDAQRPKPPERTEFHVIASGMTMLEAAAAQLTAAGYEVHNLGDKLEGDAGELADSHAALVAELVRKRRPVALLSGGEASVSLNGPAGHGGRNTTFLLALARALAGHAGVHAIACDSDGIDGHGGHAGALLAPDSLLRATALGIDARDSRARHDSAGFFEALGDLVVTGPTQTNVNDFRAILIQP